MSFRALDKLFRRLPRIPCLQHFSGKALPAEFLRKDDAIVLPPRSRLASEQIQLIRLGGPGSVRFAPVNGLHVRPDLREVDVVQLRLRRLR